jgi:hypothetical protein
MTDKTKPPCCAAAVERYEQDCWNHFDLTGPWTGWTLRGRVLISPHGDRVSASRVQGLMFVETLRIRRDAAQMRQQKRTGTPGAGKIKECQITAIRRPLKSNSQE